MHPATRSQVDYDPLANSLANQSEVNDNDIGARQEEAAEADINNIVGKFGIHALTGRQAIQNAIVDFTQGLQEAMEIIQEVRTAYDRLPDQVKERYTKDEVETAILTGETLDLSTKEDEPTKVTQVTEKVEEKQ